MSAGHGEAVPPPRRGCVSVCAGFVRGQKRERQESEERGQKGRDELINRDALRRRGKEEKTHAAERARETKALGATVIVCVWGGGLFFNISGWTAGLEAGGLGARGGETARGERARSHRPWLRAAGPCLGRGVVGGWGWQGRWGAEKGSGEEEAG